MKGNRIDELFRNGLESHKSEVPAGAWSKIEESLPQKSKKGVYFWLSIAASMILLATLGWLAFNNQQSDSPVQPNVLSENKSEPIESVSPKADTNLQASAPEEKKEEQVDIIQPVEDLKVGLPSLVAEEKNEAYNDINQEVKQVLASSSEERAQLKIETISPLSLKPQLLITDIRSHKAMINTEAFMQNLVLTEEEFNALETEGKRKFGFINSIVSVARGVNNGTKALSEIRKSKNEFVTNDLKYGTKTDATTEGSEDEDELQLKQ